MKTRLYFRLHPKTHEHEFYHLCGSSRNLHSTYHKENTRYPNKCPTCFYQIPGIYLMGGRNQEIKVFANSSIIRRGSLINVLRKDVNLYGLMPIPDLYKSQSLDLDPYGNL